MGEEMKKTTLPIAWGGTECGEYRRSSS